MNRIFCKFWALIFFFLLILWTCTGACAREESTEYTIAFSWMTGGSGELLARKATALKQLKKNGVALSLGSLLGPTRIVEHNNGADFLRAAKQAGIDFVIPAAEEFMFGYDVFRRMAESYGTPRFLSSNLVDEKTHRPVVEPFISFDISGRRISIIAMSDTEMIRKAEDKHVAGLDIIPYDEALDALSQSIARENASLVVVAGRMDRESVLEMAEKYDFIDIFVTNNQSGGFSDSLGTTSTVSVAGKPVYIVPEAGDHIGVLTITHRGMVESREFRDVTIGEVFPPDEEISSYLSSILDKLEKQDTEESIINKTGGEVAGILKKVFDVDVVFLERQSLFYFPLKDSLTLYDTRRVVKPEKKITRFILKGSLLKSVLSQSSGQDDLSLRLLSAGITDDWKVNSIPIQDDIDYSVLTTAFLRGGGDGYEQFTMGTDETTIEKDMLKIVEKYLVEKEKLLRKLAKPKVWELNLYITMQSNYNRKDVDVDKYKYGDDIPKIWRSYDDFYKGDFIINSMNNELTMNKTIGKHIIYSRLRASWSRTGSKTHTQSGIIYDEPRNSDPVELSNKYSYNLPYFPVKPYCDILIKSFLYSGAGKHPVTAVVSSGATRTFPGLYDLTITVGIHGTRDYTTLKNTAGIKTDIELKKDFPAGKILKTPISINTITRIKWNPSHEYYMSFQHENYNTIRFKIMEKVSIDLDIKTFSYRSTKQRKVALGFYYLLALSYGMHWKF